jgi:hypothetical protein
MITSSSEIIVGNAPVADAGIAGGVQSTATQLGGVMGTAILGSILTTHIGAVLFSRLVAACTPAVVARTLDSHAAVELAGQGLAPHLPRVPATLRASVTTGMHATFVSGLHTSLTVGGIIALAASVLALAARSGSGARTERARVVA